MDVTDAFLKVVHAMEYCDKESRRSRLHLCGSHLVTQGFFCINLLWHEGDHRLIPLKQMDEGGHQDYYRQGYYTFKNLLQDQWGVRLGMLLWRHIGPEEMAETLRLDGDYYKKYILGEWPIAYAASTPSGSVPSWIRDAFLEPRTLTGSGPHLYTASDLTQGWCAGPGHCIACIEKRGCTVQEVLQWKEHTGRKGFEAFGPQGAHCSQVTYDLLRRHCVIERRVNASYALNRFIVHAHEGVPDGMLVPCDCGIKEKL